MNDKPLFLVSSPILREHEPPSRARPQRSVIILTADENASLELPKLALQCGLEPVSLGRIADLKSCLLNSRVSLVLCEERLPDGSFHEALQFLRSITRSVPLIVFSRMAEWENYLEAMRFGAYDCLRYPFRRGELQWIVGRMLIHRGDWSLSASSSI